MLPAVGGLHELTIPLIEALRRSAKCEIPIAEWKTAIARLKLKQRLHIIASK